MAAGPAAAVAYSGPAMSSAILSDPVPAVTARDVLGEVFGYGDFRGAQDEIIDHVTDGGDALVLMPTGGGKSLCYQVPAIVRHRAGQGVAVVVSPLIALMHDQVGALEEAGVHAAFLNSTLDGEAAARIEREMMSGRLVLLYAAPERIADAALAGPARLAARARPAVACSRSTRRTASASGATTSARTTSSSRCCTSAIPACRGSRSPRPPTT